MVAYHFSRPWGNEIKPDRVVPKGTAFEPRLYETRGLPPEKAQTMEKDFMAKLDTDAAAALVSLEGGVAETAWTNQARNSWSKFLVAQMHRTRTFSAPVTVRRIGRGARNPVASGASRSHGSFFM